MIPDQPALGSKNTSIYKEKRACWHAVYTYTKQNWCRETHRGRHLTGKQAVCAGKLLPQSIPDCLVGLSSLSLSLSLLLQKKNKRWTARMDRKNTCSSALHGQHTHRHKERETGRQKQAGRETCRQETKEKDTTTTSVYIRRQHTAVLHEEIPAFMCVTRRLLRAEVHRLFLVRELNYHCENRTWTNSTVNTSTKDEQPEQLTAIWTFELAEMRHTGTMSTVETMKTRWGNCPLLTVL